MTNSEAVSGVHTYALYGIESTFNTAVTTDTHWSATTQNVKLNINNNTIKNYAFSGLDAVEGRKVYNYTHGTLELTGTSEFKVTNWSFLEPVLGDLTTATYTVTAKPPSVTLSTNIDNPGPTSTDMEVIASGGVIDGCNIKTSTGQAVSCSLDFKFAKFVIDTALSTRVALPNEDTYDFAGGDIELPDGTSIPNIIDSVDLTIKNNMEILYGVGSRLGRSYIAKGLDLSMKLSVKYLDNDLITAALGATTPTDAGSPTEFATMVFNFVKGANSIAITLTGVPITEFAQLQNLQDPVMEDISLTAKSISAVTA